ncbi:MAG: hypothetical protein KKD39_07775 [Candidatus Altiarchaeota archaeon]|nr:hypothetical protein [Candidatus Altiarchaeota archaeon]
MVLKELYEVWSGDGLLNDSLDDIQSLFDKAKKIFVLSVDDLVKNEAKSEQEIDRLENEIDSDTKNTRRRIVEYLAVNKNPNISAALVLGQVLTDLERIGDISQDILGLDKMYDNQLTNSPFSDNVETLKHDLSQLFDDTKVAFKETDVQRAKNIIQKNIEIRAVCDEMFKRLWGGENQIIQETMVYVLTFRYIRRVSEHLKNIASSIIKPYHEIGHSK